MSTTTDTVDLDFNVNGTEQGRKKIKDLGGDLSKTNDQYKQLSDSAAKTSSTLAALGGSLGKLSPEFADLGSAVGRASGAITSMTSVLGGGALGIAAGGLIALLGIYADKMHDAQVEADKLAEAQKKSADAAEEQFKALIEFRDKLLSQDAPAYATQYADSLKNLTQALEELRAKRRAAGGEDSITRHNLDDEITRTKEAIQVAREKYQAEKFYAADRKRQADIAGAESDMPDKTGPDPYRGMATKGLAPETELDRANHTLMVLQQQADASKTALDTAQNQYKNQEILYQADVSHAKAALDQKIKDEQSATQDFIAEAKRRDAELQRVDDARKEAWDDMRQAGQRAYQVVGSVGINTLNQLAKGQKVTGKQILSAIGDTLVAEGTRTLFQGLAISANPFTPGAGAGLIGIGTAEIASGISFGAIAGGGASATSSGGGVGGGPTFWTGTGFKPGSPISPAMILDQDNGGHYPIIVNFHSTFAPSAEDGVRATQSIQEAQRQGRI